MKFFRKNDGLISVFLTLILVPTLAFGCSVSDFVKIIGSKTVISGAADLTLNAALTNYDASLKDNYGLFAMSKTPENLQGELESYFNTCLNAANGDGVIGYENMLQLDSTSFALHTVANTEVCQPNIMNQQILEYSKYRAPVALGEDILEKLKKVKDTSRVQKAVEKQLDVGEAFEDVQEACDKVYQDLKGHVESQKNAPNMQNVVNEVSRNYLNMAIFVIAAVYFEQAENADGISRTQGNIAEYNEIANELNIDALGIDALNQNFECIVQCLSMDVDENLEATEEEKAQYEINQENVNKCRAKIEGNINAEMVVSEEVLKKADENLEKIKTTGEISKQNLEKIEELINDPNGIQKKLKEWKQAIDKIEDEEQKAAQNKQYEEYNKLLGKDSLNSIPDLKTKLENNIDYSSRMINHINSIKFCDIPIIENSNAYLTYQEVAKNYIISPYTLENLDDQSRLFHADKFTIEVARREEELKSIEDNEFYKQLKASNTSPSNGDKEEKENEVNSWIESGKDGQETAKEEPTGLQNADWDSITIPSTYLEKVEKEKKNDNLTSVDGSVSNIFGRRKMSKTSKSALQSGGSLLGDIASTGTSAVEKLYLSEYIMDMFSYYTVDKDSNGNSIDAKTLSGVKLSDNNTAMYRSEVEYILWGNKNAATNVAFTSGTIFGIRFVANCVYVFTDPEKVATAAAAAAAIASWTIFGVPLVQNAILLGMAIYETGVDISDLLAGKSVAFYHSTSMSNFKLNYKEYLQILLLINSISNEKKDRMLARTADCMQLNLKKRGAKTDMTTEVTMLTATADVTTSTMFLYMIPKLTGSSTQDESNKYTIKYKGVMAY